jgi:DNA-binding beta-propeller fold protein YncE
MGAMRALTVPALIGATTLLAGCGGSHAGATATRTATTAATAPCASRAAAVPALAHVRTAMAPLPAAPYAIVSRRRYSFVSAPGQVDVLRNSGFAPRVVRRVGLPAAAGNGQPGLALTHDGRYLLVAAGSGAVVIDVHRAENGSRRAVLGRLTSATQGNPALAGSVAVAISPDDRYAYVARSRASGIAVFDLAAALADRLRRSGYLGRVPLLYGPSDVAADPGGRWLYATSLASATGAGSGTLSLIDATRARTDPSTALVHSVAAGCEPVRVALSAGGRLVWVTALADHAVLGFSRSLLLHRPRQARIAHVLVGSAPVGVLPVDSGRRLLVADSGPSAVAAPGPGVTVVDVSAALAGRPAALGAVAAGIYPRELTVPPGRRTAYVTNSGSAQVEAVNLNDLP